ncbi:hypothetical protein L1049_014751 [Liquidambar formosana]|uniref:Uncharacterized protein n=1 Tax=Liquidambar formosana TaxID=63359 RepID=A0AAP0X0Y8_LIQFO
MEFYWSMLFMNQNDLVTIKSKATGSSVGISNLTEEIIDDTSRVDILVHWKFAENLPKEAKDGTTCTPSITAAAPATLESKMTEYLKDNFSILFGQKAFETVMWPRQPAGVTFATSPELEFCAVLDLDQNVRDEILSLRRNLLKYVHVSEFDEKAEFFYLPCPLIALEGIFCRYKCR